MFLRQSIFVLMTGLLLAFSSSVSTAEMAGKPVAVIELFTSQGCSSCPPADALLQDLDARGDIVALSYHVDYWDYLGWKDTLGSPENTARQRAYGRSFGASSVYTPQMVVNGRTHVVGSRRSAVTQAIDSRTGTNEGLTVELTASYAGDNVVINAGSAASSGNKAHLLLVSFHDAQIVDIKRGENTGKKITYLNAVTSVQTIGVWKGKDARYELPLSEITQKGSGGCAVLLQAMDANGLPGAILGATMVTFPAG